MTIATITLSSLVGKDSTDRRIRDVGGSKSIGATNHAPVGRDPTRRQSSRTSNRPGHPVINDRANNCQHVAVRIVGDVWQPNKVPRKPMRLALKVLE